MRVPTSQILGCLQGSCALAGSLLQDGLMAKSCQGHLGSLPPGDEPPPSGGLPVLAHWLVRGVRFLLLIGPTQRVNKPKPGVERRSGWPKVTTHKGPWLRGDHIALEGSRGL